MSGILGQKHRLLGSGVAAAHHEHFLAGEELTVAGSAVGHAPAPVIRFAPKANHSGMGAGGQQNAEGFQFTPGGFDGLDIPGHIQAFHFRQHKFRAEGFRLLPHGLGQFRAGGFSHTGVIHYLMGDCDLTAEFFLFQHQGAVFGTGQVQRRR